ncbi:unnamed protein product [Anisakis simplex]|uniref:Uncharacterized protein n=1 Tax=Anisakis simplex TaxID=6269 RepID=A0A0M3J9X1_ANISI|nr:unnamed protein product [Anisakis simplex]
MTSPSPSPSAEPESKRREVLVKLIESKGDDEHDGIRLQQRTTTACVIDHETVEDENCASSAGIETTGAEEDSMQAAAIRPTNHRSGPHRYFVGFILILMTVVKF